MSKSKTLSFWIPGRPKAKQRHRTGAHGHRYNPSQTDEDIVRAYAQAAIIDQKFQLITRGIPVLLYITFLFQKPKSAPKWRRFPTVKPDLDNLVKLIKDALNGLAWDDDAQVCEMKIRKAYSGRETTHVSILEGWSQSPFDMSRSEFRDLHNEPATWAEERAALEAEEDD